MSAPARRTSRISSTLRTPPPTVRGTNARRSGPLDDVQQRPAAFGRRGDVEEHELVRALLRVALCELGRVALVDEVDEPGALHHAAVGHVEARITRRRSIRRRSRRRWRSSAAVRPGPLGVELDADEFAMLTADTNDAVLGLGEDRRGRPRRRQPDVGVDEVEVRVRGDAREGRVLQWRTTRFQPMCGSVGASSRRTVRPGSTPSVWAPSSSEPSNRSWSPRQMPRNGRSAATQARIGSTSRRRGGAPSRARPPRRGRRAGPRRRSRRRWSRCRPRRRSCTPVDRHEVAGAVVHDDDERPGSRTLSSQRALGGRDAHARGSRSHATRSAPEALNAASAR